MPITNVGQAIGDHGIQPTGGNLENIPDYQSQEIIRAYFGMDVGDNNCPVCDHPHNFHIVGMTRPPDRRLWFINCKVCAEDRGTDQFLCFDNGKGPDV